MTRFLLNKREKREHTSYYCGYGSLRFNKEIKQKANFINPTPEDYEEATSLITQFPDQKITLFDAVTVILAKQLKLPVWTYDYHFDIMQCQVWR